MGKHNHKVKIIRPKNITYMDKPSLFANKEIIFRSRGRAKVFNISSRFQIIFLTLIVCIAAWSAYSYHVFQKSGNIISYQNKEIDETRDAYAELMSDFITIHKNIGAMINSLDNEKLKNQEEIDNYKQQVTVFEDKIKQNTATEQEKKLYNDLTQESLKRWGTVPNYEFAFLK